MPVGQRSQSPARLPSPSGSRGQSLLSMSAVDQQAMATFSHFSYENAMSPFALTTTAGGPSAEGGPPVYSHNPTGTYHMAPTSHSGYGSPISNHSSPSPYGDFGAFSLSPPSTGGALSSFISQQHQSTHGQLVQHQQPLSSMDLSSPVNSSTFEISSTAAQAAHVPIQRQHRRDSYSTTTNDPSYDRRQSVVSVGSLRNLQPASPYPSYLPLDNNAGAHSQIYGSPALSANVPNQGQVYMDPGRHTVTPAPTSTSSPHLIQSSIVNEGPRLTHTPVSQMGPPSQPSSKLATRQYRKKTPPEACAVCSTGQTPEWRKGPSGPRTLCNACGLTAAKQEGSEPKTIKEVWEQLTEIGSTRFRGNFVLGEKREALAAQSWSSQSQSSGRQSHSGRTSYSASATTSPTSKSTRTSFANIPGQQPKPSANSRNPAEIDAAQQLFSLSRGRGNSLGAGIPLSRSTLPPPSPLTHMGPYGITTSPGGASLNMIPSSGSHNSARLAYQPQQLSPATCHSHRHMLEMYSESINAAAGGHSFHGRRNSIGGHRMAISSIINQDPPTRPTSSMNTNAHIPQFQHQQQAQHLHHQLLLQHSSEAGYHK